jgi:peptide/nickel transport system substrate-binding protein
MKRRQFLQAATVALAAPSLARAQEANTLKFIPQADLAVLDPVWTTADVTRNHAHMVFDTLYGMDSAYAPQPQMAAGQTIGADGREWVITLRDNLQFHDGTPVLARDAVASIRRWGKRDGFGQVLMAATDELSAPTDKTINFQLKKPFPLLSTALATTTNMCPVMPERLAATDPNTQVTEMTGSGPFRFKADERVAGARVVYEKFAGYVPRGDGKPEFTSGPKAAHFDRVVWTVSPDPATNAAALGAGEFDWWENPTIDLVPALKSNKNLVVTVTDHTGEMGCLRFNHLFPPFDNPAIRRIVVSAMNQHEIMQAVAGAAPELIAPECGIFIPGTPMASTTGIAEAMKGAADPAALQKQLAAAGYTGQKIVLLCASDFPTINAEAQVCADTLKRIGFNVDYQSLDWGTVVQRRASKEPPEHLLHLSRRHRQRLSRLQHRHPLRRRDGLVRLADRPRDGRAPRRLVRRARPRRAEGAVRENASQVLGKPALRPARHLLPADGVQQIAQKCAGRISAVLRRAAGVAARSRNAASASSAAPVSARPNPMRNRSAGARARSERNTLAGSSSTPASRIARSVSVSTQPR